MVVAYKFSSDRSTPQDLRVADAVAAAGSGGTAAADLPFGAARLRFGSGGGSAGRQDAASLAVARVCAAAEAADAAAAAAAADSMPDSDDDDLLDMGAREPKRQRKQTPAKQPQQARAREAAVPWWQQKPAELGASFKSPAAGAVRQALAGRPAAAAAQQEQEQEEEATPQQQQQPSQQQQQQHRAAPAAAALPTTPPVHLRQEADSKVGQCCLAVCCACACGPAVGAGGWILWCRAVFEAAFLLHAVGVGVGSSCLVVALVIPAGSLHTDCCLCRALPSLPAGG